VIFAMLADPRKHVLIDGSGTVKRLLSAPGRLTLGAKFGMGMRFGVPSRIRNTVIEFEEGERIAWRHFVRHVWRHGLRPLQPADDGTPRTYVRRDLRPAAGPGSVAAGVARLPAPQRRGY